RLLRRPGPHVVDADPAVARQGHVLPIRREGDIPVPEAPRRGPARLLLQGHRLAVEAPELVLIVVAAGHQPLAVLGEGSAPHADVARTIGCSVRVLLAAGERGRRPGRWRARARSADAAGAGRATRRGRAPGAKGATLAGRAAGAGRGRSTLSVRPPRRRAPGAVRAGAAVRRADVCARHQDGRRWIGGGAGLVDGRGPLPLVTGAGPGAGGRH